MVVLGGLKSLMSDVSLYCRILAREGILDAPKPKVSCCGLLVEEEEVERGHLGAALAPHPTLWPNSKIIGDRH